MLLQILRYRFVKFHLHAYINHELSPQTRRLVARLIDEDVQCYQAYLEQRALSQDIGRTMATIGRTDHQQLDRIWGGIQAQLAQPTTPDPALQTKAIPLVQYVVALVLLVCVLCIPTLGEIQPSTVTGLPVIQALPDSGNSMTTPSVLNTTRVAQVLVTPAPTGILSAQSLDNTPALSTPAH